MPKNNIDYSNTIIYKIYCNDETISDVYVGHTTNFYVRKYQHKNACNDLKHNYKIYKTIRENGGWDNWNMVEIANYNCKNSTEARIKEQQHYEELKPSLNCCPPYAKKTQYFCPTCNLQFDSLKIYNHHTSTHIIETNDLEKVVNKIYCKLCDFGCNKKGDWNRHLTTGKHKRLINPNSYTSFHLEKQYTCNCGKVYKHMSSLCAHKKICKDHEMMHNGINIKDKDALIVYLLKQNGELQNKLIEIAHKQVK